MAEHIYRCTKCGKEYSPNDVLYLCPTCAQSYCPGQPLEGVLETLFDYDSLRGQMIFRERQTTHSIPTHVGMTPANPDWSLICAVETKWHPQYAVGNTPITKASRLAKEIGSDELWIKNDGLNPSGSLKDRASFLVVAHANQIGEQTIVTASTGNAASALAAVCAAAGKKAIIYVPASAPRAKLLQTKLYGADVIMVDGSYDEAFRLSLEHTEKSGGLNRNTGYHPLTIEGKKTVSLEIYSDLINNLPDNIVVPVGDGVIIAGVYKGFLDLLRIGLIEKLPRLICVQAETSNAIHNLIENGSYQNAEAPVTVADSISVSTPSNAWMAAHAVKETNGFSVTVTDEQILYAQALLARTAGVFAEPAAAAGLAGLKKAITKGNAVNGRTVLLVTGHGLKDIDAPRLTSIRSTC